MEWGKGEERKKKGQRKKENPSRREISPCILKPREMRAGRSSLPPPALPHPKNQQEGRGSRSPSDAGAAMTAAAAWPVCTICYEDLRPLSDQHLHCLPACGHVFHALWSVPSLLRSFSIQRWLAGSPRSLLDPPARAAWSNGWSTAPAARRSAPAPSASSPAAPRTRRPASTSSPPARARPRPTPPRRTPPRAPTRRRSPPSSRGWSRRRRPSARWLRSSAMASRTSTPR